ncbi:MAG: hypothetical protein LBT81_02395 [Helicobacteraceae bacterium]|nr:hypothetical protein [Helicobacteraceae bacterium]
MKIAVKPIHNARSIAPVTGALDRLITMTSAFAQKDMFVNQEFGYAGSGNPTCKALAGG